MPCNREAPHFSGVEALRSSRGAAVTVMTARHSYHLLGSKEQEPMPPLKYLVGHAQQLQLHYVSSTQRVHHAEQVVLLQYDM